MNNVFAAVMAEVERIECLIKPGYPALLQKGPLGACIYAGLHDIYYSHGESVDVHELEPFCNQHPSIANAWVLMLREYDAITYAKDAAVQMLDEYAAEKFSTHRVFLNEALKSGDLTIDGAIFSNTSDGFVRFTAPSGAYFEISTNDAIMSSYGHTLSVEEIDKLSTALSVMSAENVEEAAILDYARRILQPFANVLYNGVYDGRPEHHSWFVYRTNDDICRAENGNCWVEWVGDNVSVSPLCGFHDINKLESLLIDIEREAEYTSSIVADNSITNLSPVDEDEDDTDGFF
jgi:hypothetical protein